MNLFGVDRNKIKLAFSNFEQRLETLKDKGPIPDPRILNLEQFIQELKDVLIKKE